MKTYYYEKNNIINVREFVKNEDESDFKFNMIFNEIIGVYRLPNEDMISFKREENLKTLLN